MSVACPAGCSVPQDVLESHLAAEPGTPVEELGAVQEDNRVVVPKRVALQVVQGAGWCGVVRHSGASAAGPVRGAALQALPSFQPAATRPISPHSLPAQGVRCIAAGWEHTVAVTDEEVYSWGCNNHGQLGTRSFRSASLPSEVLDLRGRGVCQVACGAEHTLFSCRDGSVYGCGSTEHGQLPLAAPLDPAAASAALQQGEAARSMCVATPSLLRLDFLRGAHGSRPAEVSQVVAAAHCSAFLTRASDELPEAPQPRLWERLQAAVAAATEAAFFEMDAYIRPIAAAVERIFGSAAAISAAFGLPDKVGRCGAGVLLRCAGLHLRSLQNKLGPSCPAPLRLPHAVPQVGLDVQQLAEVQQAIVALEPRAAPRNSDPQPTQDTLYQVGGAAQQAARRWRAGFFMEAARGCGPAAFTDSLAPPPCLAGLQEGHGHADCGPGAQRQAAGHT